MAQTFLSESKKGDMKMRKRFTTFRQHAKGFEAFQDYIYVSVAALRRIQIDTSFVADLIHNIQYDAGDRRGIRV